MNTGAREHRRHVVGAWLVPVAYLSAAAMGCVNTPRNQEKLGSPHVFHLSGNVPTAGQPVAGQLWNYRTRSWLNWGSTTSASGTGAADCSGTKWYSFEHTMLVPRAASLFAPSRHSGHNELKARATLGVNGAPLASFEANADSCGQQYCAGSDVIDHCKSPESPVLTLHVPCGDLNEACCWNGGETGCGGYLLCDGDFTCRNSDWLPADQYQSRRDSPSNAQADWTPEAQGIATDGNSWYLTQGTGYNRLWKVPFGQNFYDDFSGHPRTTNDLGCNHWGDPDVANGVVYVPLENCSSGGNKIAAFRASDLSLIGVQPTNSPSAAWVAVNPLDSRVYIAPEFDNVSRLWAFRKTVNASTGVFTLTFEDEIPIRDSGASGWYSPRLRRVQGGAFSNSGKLYLSLDDEASDDGKLVGLQVSAKVALKRMERRVPVSYGTAGEELEGIEVFPAGDDWGDIHIVLLDNDWAPFGGGPDDVLLKHYKLTDPDSL